MFRLKNESFSDNCFLYSPTERSRRIGFQTRSTREKIPSYYEERDETSWESTLENMLAVGDAARLQ